MMDRNTRYTLMLPIVWACLLALLPTGCTALTNPGNDAIPARRVPSELLAPSRNGEETIPLSCLGQPTPDAYRLAPGDVLGVYVEGFLGERTQLLPTHIGVGAQLPGVRPLPASVGYPVPAESNGTIDLPRAGSLLVAGKTIAEARDAIRQLYSSKLILKKEETDRVLVSLLQPRYASVLVLRQETSSHALNGDELRPVSKRGLGFQLDLPGYENDVLHALARSGGLPGLDDYNEVVIQRSCFCQPQDRAALLGGLGSVPADQCPLHAIKGGECVRIPLRQAPGMGLPFRLQDIILHTGDVVFLEARDHPYFYTAGLLPSGRHNLPRDRDLDVIEAITVARGPILNGAFGGSNLSGDLVRPGIGNPSPRSLTVLRRTSGGGQVPIHVDLHKAMRDPSERIVVRNGDVLLLQEAPNDALARYFTQTFFNFNLVWEVIHTPFATGAIDISAPDRLPGRLTTVNVNTPTR